MVIQVLETVTKEEGRKREKLGSVQPIFCSVWHTRLSGGASDSVRCTRLIRGELTALGFQRRRTTMLGTFGIRRSSKTGLIVLLEYNV
jgi:hypothetical protein